MNNVITMEAIPNDAELLAIALSAASRGFKLITNGTVTRVCSIVPQGWREMPVMIKHTNEAA
jgi:hypothetical protein